MENAKDHSDAPTRSNEEEHLEHFGVSFADVESEEFSRILLNAETVELLDLGDDVFVLVNGKRLFLGILVTKHTTDL